MRINVIVTDLDGTLLDEAYGYDGVVYLISRLEERGVPVVFSSSKSRAEIEYYRRSMGAVSPFISENGAAIYIDSRDPYLRGINGERAGDYIRIVLGATVDEIMGRIGDLLEDYRRRGLISLLSEMAIDEISTLTGLPPELAALARIREFSIVFHPHSPRVAEEIRVAVEEKGLRVSTGAGKLYSITGAHDKGTALRVLRELYIGQGYEPVFIALGDGLNDAPMLREAETAVLLGGRIDVAEAVGRRDLVVLENRGPMAWSRIVSSLIPCT